VLALSDQNRKEDPFTQRAQRYTEETSKRKTLLVLFILPLSPLCLCGESFGFFARSSYWLLCRFHLQRIIEAVEVVEQADGGCELYDFPFIEMTPQLCEQLVLNLVGVQSEAFGETQGGFFGGGKIAAFLEFRQLFDLIFRPAQPFCQNGVRGQSIRAMVELGGAHDDEFFELGGDGAGIHDCAQVRNHGAEDFRPMRSRAEHVGHVAALFLIELEDLARFRIDLVPSEA